MTREHKKKFKKTQGKQYLIKQVAFTERNRAVCLLFSPTFTSGLLLRFFIRRYLSINYWRGKGTWPLRRGQTFKIKNSLMQRADNIVKTWTIQNKSKLAAK